ncbi:MAG: sensor histidine kinase [Rhizobiaceae bacterium]
MGVLIPDYEQLFGALPSPHMVVDRDFRYVAVNEAYERVVMRSRGDLLGHNLFELFPNPGEGGRKLRHSFERVFETGRPDTLAYIPYDIPRPEAEGGGMEQRFWTAVHTPLLDPSGAVTHLVQNTTDVTDIVRLREAASLPFRPLSGETQLLERAREAEQQHQALLGESEEFRRLFRMAPGFFAVLTGPEHVFTFANDAYIRLIGGRNVIGKRLGEALPEIEGQGFVEMLDRVYETGKPAGGEAMRLMLQRAHGEAPRETFLDFSYDAIRNPDGQIAGVFVQGMDRTEAVRTQRRQKLLLDELNHRVKNTLATVQSIARQTLRSARDTASAGRDFEARIIALSKAHNLLSARQWASTELSALVCQELSIHGEGRVESSGPSVVLDPKASIAFAMLLHELATNAAKYGALSTPTGVVSVTWSREGIGADGMLRLDWAERGGPPVDVPSRKGFGSRMVERVAVGELGGTIEAIYDPAGFRCRMDVPLASLGKKDDAGF